MTKQSSDSQARDLFANSFPEEWLSPRNRWAVHQFGEHGLAVEAAIYASQILPIDSKSFCDGLEGGRRCDWIVGGIDDDPDDDDPTENTSYSVAEAEYERAAADAYISDGCYCPQRGPGGSGGDCAHTLNIEAEQQRDNDDAILAFRLEAYGKDWRRIDRNNPMWSDARSDIQHPWLNEVPF